MEYQKTLPKKTKLCVQETLTTDEIELVRYKDGIEIESMIKTEVVAHNVGLVRGCKNIANGTAYYGEDELMFESDTD